MRCALMANEVCFSTSPAPLLFFPLCSGRNVPILLVHGDTASAAAFTLHSVNFTVTRARPSEIGRKADGSLCSDFDRHL